MADLQGFLTSLTIDGNDLTSYTNTVGFDQSVSTDTKQTMNGSPYSDILETGRSATLTASGQVDSVGHPLMQATFAKADPVTFSLVVGQGAPVAAGTYSGSVKIDQFPLDADTQDTWNWSLNAMSSGPVTYTPVV